MAPLFHFGRYEEDTKVTVDKDGVGGVVWCRHAEEEAYKDLPRYAETLLEKSQSSLWNFFPSFLGYRIERTKTEENQTPGSFLKLIKEVLNPELYTVDKEMASLNDKWWYTRHEVSHVGNTSYVLKAVLRESESGPILACREEMFVRMNLSTRKPDIIPRHLKEKQESIQSPKKMHVPKIFEVPLHQLVFSYVCPITKEHVDSNNHTNMNVYRILLLQCLRSANELGVFGTWAESTGKNAEVKQFLPREIKMLYAKESGLGDSIRIDVWKKEDEKYAAKAILSLKEEVLVCGWVCFHDAVRGLRSHI